LAPLAGLVLAESVMTMLSTWFSLLVGGLGLGLVTSIGCLVAWWLIPEVPWLTSRARQALLIVGIVTGAGTFIYAKGVADGIGRYQAKLTQQINKAIQSGDRAREEILKKFDATKDIPDDGFARD
jgi:hypothetical protein